MHTNADPRNRMTGSIIVSSLLVGSWSCYRVNNPPTTKQPTHPPRHACKACGTGLQTQPCMYFNTQTVTLKQTNRSTKHSHVNIVKQADQHTAMYTDNKTWRQTQAMHSCTDSKTLDMQSHIVTNTVIHTDKKKSKKKKKKHEDTGHTCMCGQ